MGLRKERKKEKKESAPLLETEPFKHRLEERSGCETRGGDFKTIFEKLICAHAAHIHPSGKNKALI